MKHLFSKYRNKLLMFFALGISILGVVVCGFSTLAWFRLEASTQELAGLNNNLVSGTSDVNINNVTGYKYTYDELGDGNTDYSNGHLTAYNAYTAPNAAADTSFDGNIHQGQVTAIDAPAEGIGYYIVGNAKFCEMNGFNANDAWTYNASIRLDNDSAVNTNIARLINFDLYSTEYTAEQITAAGGIDKLDLVEFKIRHHYISGTETVDAWMNTKLASNEDTTDTLTAPGGEGGNFVMANNTSAKFTIYLNNSWQLALIRNGDADDHSGISRNINSNKKAITRSLGEDGYIYLKPSSNWSEADAYFIAHFWKDGSSSYDQNITMSQLASTGIYYVQIPNNNVDRIIFCRMNPTPDNGDSGGWWIQDNNDNRWHKVWNESPTEQFKTRTFPNTMYTFTGWTQNTQWSNVQTSITALFSDTFYYADAKNNRTLTSLGTPTKTVVEGGDDTKVVFTNSVSIKMYAGSSFKLIRRKSSSDYYMGYSFCTNINDTYFTPGEETWSLKEDGNWAKDYNVDVILNCKVTYSVTYYFSDSGWSFTATPVDFTPALFTFHIYKKNHSTGALSEVQTIDYEIDDTTTAYNLSTNPNTFTTAGGYSANFTTITGYSTRCGTYYENSTCLSGQEASGSVYGSDDWQNPKELYTYFNANKVTININVSYLNNGGTTVDSTETAAQASQNISDANQYVDTTYILPSAPTAATNYTFIGYNTLADNSGSGYSEDGFYSIGTDSTYTLYAIYKPIEHLVTFTFKYFTNDGNALSLTISDTKKAAKSNDISYQTTTYTPADLSATEAKDKYWDSTNGKYYVFTWDGNRYTNPACTSEYIYSPAAQTSDLALYIRMEASAFTSIKIDVSNINSNGNWNDPYVIFINDGDNITHTFHQLTTAQRVFSGNGSIHEFSFPVGYKFVISRDGAYDTNVGDTDYIQTVDIDVTTSDSYGNSNSNKDWVYVQNDRDSYKYKFRWEIFYKKPDNGNSSSSNGYYLVGVLKNSTSTWTFENAWKMAALTSSDKNNYGLSDTYDYAIGLENGFNIAEIEKFQIWQYDYQTGRGRMFDYGEVATSDTETNGILMDDSGNIKINPEVTGNKFAIFLDKDGAESAHTSIYVQDREKSATLYFDTELETYAESEFTLGHGDFDNNDSVNSSRTAVYEKGIYITQDDLDHNGGYVDFLVRCKNRGSYKRYCYNGKNGSGSARSGVSSSKIYSYIVEGANAGTYYGDEKNRTQSGYTMYRINTKGYYAFYVLEDGTIAVEEIPFEYGEGFYIMPVSSNTADNKCTFGFSDGRKMKVLSNAENVALYTCYIANETLNNMSIYIKGYLGGVAKDHITTTGPGIGNGENDYATMDNEGIITFNEEGAYNIYVYSTGGDTFGVSISEYTESDFFTMNTIRRSATTPDADYVKNSNTSFILKVGFSVTNSGNFNSKVCVDKILSGTGIGSSLVYTYAVDPDLGGDNCYDYMRNNCYNALSENNKQETSNISVTTGNHTLYILLDYNPSSVNSLPFSSNASLGNNFFFVIRLKSEA